MSNPAPPTQSERAIASTSRLLGEYLRISPEAIQDALTLQAAMREQGSPGSARIGEILLEMEAVSLEALLEAIQAQRVDRLRACLLFSALDNSALADLSAVFQEVTVPAGAQFITQDEKDPCLYVLASGRLEVFRSDEREGEIRIAAVFPGEPVGEMGYFSDGIRSASVRARDLSQLLRASYADLSDCFETVPEVAQAFLDVVTTRLKRTNLLYQEREARRHPVERALEHLEDYLDLGKSTEMGEGIDELIKRLVHTASRLTDADRASLFLVDPVTGELWSKVAEGAEIKEIRVPAGVGIVGWVVKHGRMLNIADAYEDERFNPEVDRRTGYRTHTILCAPVRGTGGKVLGAVQVINKQLGAFNDDDESLLRAFADQVSVAIENFSVYRELVRAHERMGRALAVATTICRSPDLERLALALASQLGELLDCAHAIAYWVEEEGGELWTVAASDGEVEELRRPWGEGFAGYCAANREVVNVPDAYEDPRFDPELDRLPGDRVRSVIAVPVERSDGRLVGVLTASNKLNAVFDREDLELLRAAAAQLAVSALLA